MTTIDTNPNCEPQSSQHPRQYESTANSVSAHGGLDSSASLPSLGPPTSKWGDADVYGELSDELLSTPVCVGYSHRGHFDKVWENARARTYGEFTETFLTTHKQGLKEGASFLQGTCHDGVRKKTAMVSMSMLGIDCDAGDAMDALLQLLWQLGYAAIVYSTHSHGKSRTDVPEAEMHRFLGEERTPTDEEAKRYLLDVSKYLPEVLRKCELMERKHTSNGMVYVIKHKRVPKFRIIFPLSEPFVFAEREGTHAEAILEWAERIAGMAALLGVQFDESCIDPSRLFYLPRHPENPPLEPVIAIIAGRPLDVNKIPRKELPSKQKKVSKKGKRASASQVAMDDAADIAVPIELRDWYAECRETSLLADLLEHVDKTRGDASALKGKITECPFDGYHSDAGNPDDTACVAANAGDGDETPSLIWKCHHNSCQGRLTLDYVARAVALGWFSADDLWSDEFNSEPRSKPKSFEQLQDWTNGLTKETPSAELEDCIKAIARAGVTPVQLASLKRITTDKTVLGRREFDAALRQASEELVELKKAVAKQDIAAGGRTVIQLSPVNEPLWCELATKALQTSNAQNPRLFVYNDQIVRLKASPEGHVGLEQMDERHLANEIGNVTLWVLDEGDGVETRFAPAAVVRHLHAEAVPFLPPLKGLVHTPIFKADGTLLDQPGYDPESQLYYAPPNNLALKPISLAPTEDEVDEAVSVLLDELLGDFCFAGFDDGQASEAHALAMLLLPFAREMISGSTPIHLISKPSPGTGASLLVDVHATVSTGMRALAKSETRDEDEFRKSLTATLMSGASYYYLDNLHRKLNSPAFASVLTTGRYHDRLLGKTQMLDLDVALQFIIAGNNPRMSSELVRRSVLIRLDAQTHDLTKRQFRYSDLQRWAAENRAELIWAALTIIQNWIAMGREAAPNKPKLASFESWAETIGGILYWAGVDGFLENQDDLKELVDAEDAGLHDFIQLWWNVFQDQAVQVGNVDPQADVPSIEPASLSELVFRHELPLPISMGYRGVPNSKSLGSYISMLRHQRFLVQRRETSGGKVEVIIEKDGETGGSARWCLKRVN